MRRRALWLALLLCVGGCATREGPRIPLPQQDVAGEVPAGKVRVVFFNNSNRGLYFDSGPIRIQLDGQQVPSIWLDHYVQVHVEPGEHHLLLEHYDLFTWKNAYTIRFDGPEIFLEVYDSPVSTNYKIVDRLPEDFATRFKPRDPNNW